MAGELTKADAFEAVLLQGDLSKLSAAERTSYYLRVCDSLGLNPLTKPFDYLSLNGKTVLYAKRDCTEQLRRRDRISVKISGREEVAGIFIVTAQATTPDGRVDESTGAVAIEILKGEARANAMMKAETKAKRRVTLSICGLGMLDESEIDSIPGAVTVPAEIHSKPEKELPPKSEEKPFKAVIDFKALLENCKTLDELAARWNTIPTHLQRDYVGIKDALKTKLTPHSDEPLEADHATGDGDPEESAYIGRDMAQAILDHLNELDIDWDEVSNDHTRGTGLSLVAGFTPQLDIKVTELLPEQGLRLLAELKKRVQQKREQASRKGAGKQAVTA